MTDETTPARPTITMSDGELAAWAQDGDQDAFGLLYERHAPRIYTFLNELVKDRVLAEDLTQTTFLKAFERIRTLRAPEAVRAWLYAIAHNCARMHVRHVRVESLEHMREATGFSPEADEPSPEEAAVTTDMQALVWTAAQSLDPRQYTVLSLSIRHELGAAEIAEVVGTSTAHASVLIHRAREALGGAVRTLAVGRMQKVCPRLRELVPVGQSGPLSASQRRSVEHHMRSCTECHSLADQLTAPAELLGGMVLLPLPAALARPDWLHGTHSLATTAQTAARPWWRGGRTIGRRVRVPVAALGVAGAAAIAGAVGGVLALTHHGPATPAVVIPVTAQSAAPAPSVSPTAAPVSAAPTPADESSESADAVWADAMTAMRGAQSYRIAFTTTSLSDDVTHFDVQFTRDGSFDGTVTLALASADPFTVRKAAGTLYAQGAALQRHADLFGLTAQQASQLGGGWLQLTGTTRQYVATLVDRTLSMWAPQQITTTVLHPDGTLRLAGTDAINGEPVIVLRDDSGTVAVTRFGAELRRASNAIDSAAFSQFNVPVTVAAPPGALVLP